MKLFTLLLMTAVLGVPGRGLAGDDAPAEDAFPTAGWDNGFFIQSPDGKFKLSPRARLQVRYTFESTPGEAGREGEGAFELKRMIVGIKGHLFTKRLTFRFEMDFGKGSFTPKYMWMDYKFVAGHLQVRAGNFKRPFSRGQHSGDEKQALVDRAITDKAFRAGYDIGLMLHNGKKERFEWAVSLTNGGSRTALGGDVEVDPETGEGEITGGGFSNTVDQLQPTTTVRVGYNHAGIEGYDELDLAGGGFRFAVGGSVQISRDIAGEQDGWFGAELDAIVKVLGFSATAAVYVSTVQDGEQWTDQAVDDFGLHFQLAYLIKGKVAPAFRYARVQSLAGDEVARQELAGGVHVLFCKRHLTWSTDLAALGGTSLAPGETDFRVRSQAQVHF